MAEGKRLCFHRWLRWSDPVLTSNSGHKQQWRVCEHCNKAQFRTLWWDKQTALEFVRAAIASTREAS
jgi:hypothetical protein